MERRALFQSYHSAIKTKYVRFRRDPASVFQSYHSAIKTSNLVGFAHATGAYFNPTIVRLRHGPDDVNTFNDINFNPTIVRLRQAFLCLGTDIT